MSLAGKRVLVLGASGFLGGHIFDALRRRNAEQDILAPPHKYLDLLDQLSTCEYLHRNSPNLVIHSAARMGGIGANRARPGLFFYENLMMGANVIEACRIAKVPKVVLIGTVCSYPRDTPVPFREEDLFNGAPEPTNGPYGQAKRMLVVQAQAYRQEYGLNAVTVLPTNMYGPRDNFDPETSHVIPALIRKIDEAMKTGKDAIPMWGDGTPTRDFLYVEDAAEAIVLAAEKYDSPEPVNIGSGADISMRDLAHLVAREMGYTGGFFWDTTKPNGQPKRRLDVSRAKKFGFEATTSFVEGIRKTFAWWREQK